MKRNASAPAISGVLKIHGRFCFIGLSCLSLLVGSTMMSRAKGEPTTNQPSAKSSIEPGLHVWFKLERPGGSRYRKPYLAVWLEDEDGFPVKTATLWWQTEQPGPRWHRDLTRWYRNNRMRRIVEKTNLVDGISGATRGPGEYETHFDGTDNSGQPLPSGKYMLCLEAARENGTYKIIRQPISWGADAISRTDLDGNIEIARAAFEFRPIASP